MMAFVFVLMMFNMQVLLMKRSSPFPAPSLCFENSSPSPVREKKKAQWIVWD
jgi:hypothetical protein